MRSGFCHSVPALGVLRNTIKSSTQLQQRSAEAAGLASVLQTPFPAEQQTDLWLQAGSILRWSPRAKENSSSLPSPFPPYFLSRTDIKEKGRTQLLAQAWQEGRRWAEPCPVGTSRAVGSLGPARVAEGAAQQPSAALAGARPPLLQGHGALGREPTQISLIPYQPHTIPSSKVHSEV